MLQVRIYFGFAVLLAAETHIYGSVTTCQTPQDIHVGEHGTIKCSFPDGVENKHFVIYKNDLNSTQHDEEQVVNCYIANKQQVCDVSSGFNFTWTNGSEQTVSISNVSTLHNGKYVCQLIPGDRDCEPCVLKVKGDLILEDKLKQEWNAVINGDRNTEGKTGEKEMSASVTAGIVFGAIAACGVVVGGVVVYRKRRGERHMGEPDGAEVGMVAHQAVPQGL